MKFLIISDMFSLDSWLIDGEKPEIMPAVYEFYNYLGNHTEHIFDAVIAHPTINKVVVFPNGSKIYIHKLSVPFHYIRKFKSLRFLKSKAKELLKINSDYTHIYGMTIYANVAREIGSDYDIPSVGRLFGSLIWDVIQKGQWLKSKTRFHYQLREIKSPCDLTICTEDGTQFDLAINKYSPGSKVHMLYNGVNKNIRKKLLALPSVNRINSDKVIRFCYIARLTYWKRQDLALDIIARLKSHGLNVSLDIYGRGETLDYLTKQIIKLNLSKEVTIKGSIPHDEMPSVLSLYDVGMFFYDASNLGNAMWEASLSGRLIFTRDSGKTSEIFNNKNSIVMNGEDTNSSVSNFIKLLDKDCDFADNSRSQVDSLLPSWQRRLDEEMEIIREMNNV